MNSYVWHCMYCVCFDWKLVHILYECSMLLHMLYKFIHHNSSYHESISYYVCEFMADMISLFGTMNSYTFTMNSYALWIHIPMHSLSDGMNSYIGIYKFTHRCIWIHIPNCEFIVDTMDSYLPRIQMRAGASLEAQPLPPRAGTGRARSPGGPEAWTEYQSVRRGRSHCPSRLGATVTGRPFRKSGASENLNAAFECKMKGLHFRLTQRLPHSVVHWNAETISVQRSYLTGLILWHL